MQPSPARAPETAPPTRHASPMAPAANTGSLIVIASTSFLALGAPSGDRPSSDAPSVYVVLEDRMLCRPDARIDAPGPGAMSAPCVLSCVGRPPAAGAVSPLFRAAIRMPAMARVVTPH